jgi:tetratricopeptide (TPR) repeat protein
MRAMTAPPPPARDPRRAIRLTAVALVLATLVAYSNGLRGPFVFDDVFAIAENPTIRRLWPLSDVLLPRIDGGVTVSGRPLLNLSFALNYAISGQAVWSYHALNVLIHVGAGLLLFGGVRRTLARRRHARATRVAAAVAALWMLHPLQTESVTYVVQRAESLLGLFFLAACYAFARGLEPEAERSRVRWHVLAVAATLAAVGTKEVAVTLPLLLLLYDRTFVAGSFGAAWRTRRGTYLALAGTWVALAALIANTGANRGGTMNLGDLAAWPAYWATQAQAVCRYVGLAIWPHPLVFDYGTFWVERAAQILPYAVLVGALLGATLIALRRWPAAGFCGAWFFLILAPTSLAPGRIQMIVEHRAYLPLAGVLTLGVIALDAWLGRRAVAAMVIAALAGGALTHRRNEDYANERALWGDTVAKRPNNALARGNFAKALAESGQFEAALVHARAAVQLRPDEAKYRYNLGHVLADAGQWSAAVVAYEDAVRLAPTDPALHNNLAIALVHIGRAAEGLPHSAAAAQLRPNDAGFHFNYGVALERAERWDEAVAEYEAALRLRPDYLDAHFNLADRLTTMGRPAQARPHFEAVLALNPAHEAAHFKLGNALMRLDDLKSATAEYRAAVQLRPDDAEAHHNLGVAYARQQRWTEAQTEFETALRLQPDYLEARQHLEQLRAR